MENGDHERARERAVVTAWIKAFTTVGEWDAIKSGATTIVDGDGGRLLSLWRGHRGHVFGLLRSNRLSTHYLLSQIVRPLHQYEINDLDVDGHPGHLLVGLTNRFDTFFQFERYAARVDRPVEFARHCLASVRSFFDGHNRGPGRGRISRVVVLDWDRLAGSGYPDPR
jgi:hypothetical protein